MVDLKALQALAPLKDLTLILRDVRKMSFFLSNGM
jgi:hypothetical protein